MIKPFTLILACCMICLSCTKDDITRDGGNHGENTPKDELAELTVVFSTPHTTSSRASDFDNPPTEVGSDAENTVSSAMIILGEMVKGINAPTIISDRQIINKLENIGGTSTLWKGVIKVKPGYYRILAIANPGVTIETNKHLHIGKPWNKLIDLAVELADIKKINEISADNNFLMSNAHVTNNLEYDFHILKGRENTIKVNVQRVCARIDFIPVKSSFDLQLFSDDVNSNVNVNMKFTHAAPVNMSKKFHLLKMITPDEHARFKTFYDFENENNFVADIDWKDKWQYFKSPVPSARLRNFLFSNTEVEDRTKFPENDMINYSKLPTQESKLFYLPENTLPGIETQVHKLSTGIIFKAEFTFKEHEFQKLTDVYYYQTKSGNKKVYKNIEGLKKDLQADKMIANPDTWTGTDEEIAKCKARKFKKAADGKFYAWYSYWNRHRDNHNNNMMGKMEFAVVRNNIYKLSINSVNSLGYPEEPTGNSIWKPAGETPDEIPLMLDIKVQVSDWVNRIYDIEI